MQNETVFHLKKKQMNSPKFSLLFKFKSKFFPFRFAYFTPFWRTEKRTTILLAYLYTERSFILDLKNVYFLISVGDVR